MNRYSLAFLLISILTPLYGIHAQDASKVNYEVIIPTFLGNDTRNYYGDVAPDKLNVVWKHYLGKGETIISRKLGSRIWAGAGWTGQPLLVKENGKLFIIQGAYDHHLKKIDATTGKLVWQYAFDDVVKGTGTIWVNKYPSTPKEGIIILQGSRLGVGNYLDTKHIPSYRAISYITGEELWRLDVKWTDSYSRDVDGSALVVNDTIYIGLENSLFTLMDPNPQKAQLKDGMLQPAIYQETPLYTKEDAIHHKNNVVTESSPCRIGDKIYIASGSGHIWGYDIPSKKLCWDFYIGSDIDGSAVATDDSCIIVSIEKQYIEGNGGALKLDPRKPESEAVVWFQPTADSSYSSWEGGVIGSVGVNDSYHKGELPYLAAINAIDGYLYIVEHTTVDYTRWVTGFDGKTKYHPPLLTAKYRTGASITTPIFDRSKIISTGYGGLYLFAYDAEGNIQRLDKYPITCESTPVIYQKRIYIASRNGYFYCLGE